MLLTAFMGISPSAYEAALHHVPRLRRPFPAAAGHAYFLLVELAAGAAFDAGLLEEALGGAIAPFMDSDDGAIANVAVDHRGGFVAPRHAVPEGLRAAGHVIACDLPRRRGHVTRKRVVEGTGG